MLKPEAMEFQIRSILDKTKFLKQNDATIWYSTVWVKEIIHLEDYDSRNIACYKIYL